MNEQELRQQVARAERARQLLNDPMIQDALKTMRENFFDDIQSSHMKDVETRDNAYLMLKTIGLFELQFKRAIDGGKVAQSILDDIKGKVKTFFR